MQKNLKINVMKKKFEEGPNKMFLLLMFPLLAIHTQMCPLLGPLTPCTLLTQIISNLRGV